MARDVRTAPITPAVADTAAALPATFPGDPADRIIDATAIETGWTLVIEDRRLRGHRHPRRVALVTARRFRAPAGTLGTPQRLPAPDAGQTVPAVVHRTFHAAHPPPQHP